MRGPSRTSINRLGSQNSANRDAKVGQHGEVERIVGTPDYLAPELLLGTGHGMQRGALEKLVYGICCHCCRRHGLGVERAVCVCAWGKGWVGNLFDFVYAHVEVV